MPFGLDLKSLILGIVLALFVFPWVKSLLMNRSSGNTKAA